MTELLPSEFFAHFYCLSFGLSRIGIPNVKSGDDPFYIKALKASFFARIASLISWFQQGVLFSLPATILSLFRSQLTTADEITAVRNDYLPVIFRNLGKLSVSSDSLSARTSHLIWYVKPFLLPFSFR